ncbi:hypothetical protein HZA44_04450 [Candidatus Peregrinibacteria bacterium]|nr:hypothetical protein [Candidatus Peregrinibacteria bacterium]
MTDTPKKSLREKVLEMQEKEKSIQGAKEIKVMLSRSNLRAKLSKGSEAAVEEAQEKGEANESEHSNAETEPTNEEAEAVDQMEQPEGKNSLEMLADLLESNERYGEAVDQMTAIAALLKNNYLETHKKQSLMKHLGLSPENLEKIIVLTLTRNAGWDVDSKKIMDWLHGKGGDMLTMTFLLEKVFGFDAEKPCDENGLKMNLGKLSNALADFPEIKHYLNEKTEKSEESRMDKIINLISEINEIEENEPRPNGPAQIRMAEMLKMKGEASLRQFDLNSIQEAEAEVEGQKIDNPKVVQPEIKTLVPKTEKPQMIESSKVVNAIDTIQWFCKSFGEMPNDEAGKMALGLNDAFPDTNIGVNLLSLSKKNEKNEIKNVMRRCFNLKSSTDSEVEAKMVELASTLRGYFQLQPKK